MYNSAWEKEAIEKILLESVKEQRRKRRWSIFFKLLILAYVAFIFLAFSPLGQPELKEEPHTALIDINGMISINEPANADHIITSMNAAIKNQLVEGIILRVNSPGGSPVQSAYIYNAINRLKKEREDIKVYAVCIDMCASGGYYVAAAADEIYASPLSLVGSIGVIANGFGFTGTMEKLGIDRRIITAGENKGFLDPFSPVNPKDTEHMITILEETHKVFANDVRTSRGDRLNTTQEIFSGLIWSGSQAKELGLIDGFASPGDIARNFIENDHVVNYTVKPNYFDRLARQFGMQFNQTISHFLKTDKGIELQ